MNPSVDSATDHGLTAHRYLSFFAGVYPVLAAMSIYSVVAYTGAEGHAVGVVAVLSGVLAYFLTMYIYFGIAWLVYEHRYRLLTVGAASAVIIACIMAGPADLAFPLCGWAMMLLAGIVTGRLTRRRYRQGQVYLIGAFVVAGLFTLQSISLWVEFLKAAPELVDNLAAQLQQLLGSQGHGPEVVRESVDQSRRAFNIVIRLFPALTVMGVLMQFSVGYLVFFWWVCRREPSQSCVPPLYWKMPFGFSVVVMGAILTRLLGGDLLQTVGDNVLAILATYYCVAGLALIEYYLRKLRVSKLMKILFYLLLLLTQLMGFLVVALVGFIDSFTDWRRSQLQKML
ncbi:MAG: DUF2232 domain-containing protein [bacterium]